MAQIRIQETASWRLDEIYRYTRDRWGNAQADRHINGLFEAFQKITTKAIQSRPVPTVFGVQGYFCRYEQHFIYWRWLSNGDIGILTVLHKRMHQIEYLREDFGL